jgi:hypothetical protein
MKSNQKTERNKAWDTPQIKTIENSHELKTVQTTDTIKRALCLKNFRLWKSPPPQKKKKETVSVSHTASQ